ncbi:MAG TPA: hypothetical protein VFJ06_04710 [Halococcus sp.]|nr:hypothetical protein [Halococcus sp.]
MRRREVIVAAGAVGLSGCLGGVRSTLGLSGNKEPPKPVKPTKPLGLYPCPKFQTLPFDAVTRTVCYREKGDGPKSVRFRASKRHAHLPPDLVEFTMTRTDSGTAFYVVSEPLVTQLTDEGWKLVAPTKPDKYDVNPVALYGDDSYTWTVGIGGENPDEKANGDLLRLGDVGPGVYAFRARGRLATGVTEASDVDIAHAMLFTVGETVEGQ